MIATSRFGLAVRLTFSNVLTAPSSVHLAVASATVTTPSPPVCVSTPFPAAERNSPLAAATSFHFVGPFPAFSSRTRKFCANHRRWSVIIVRYRHRIQNVPGQCAEGIYTEKSFISLSALPFLDEPFNARTYTRWKNPNEAIFRNAFRTNSSSHFVKRASSPSV